MIARLLLSSGVILLAASHAHASQRCAAIADDARRLECFDLEYRKTVKPVPQDSKWNVRRDVSKLDDTENVFLTLVSDNAQRGRFGGDENAVLVMACRENTTSLWVRFGGHFMADNAGGGRVTFRIDDQKASVKSFRESNNHEALGLWNGGTSIPFIKDLFKAKHLLLRATPLSESSLTYEFTIMGLDEAIKPLRAACHW